MEKSAHDGEPNNQRPVTNSKGNSKAFKEGLTERNRRKIDGKKRMRVSNLLAEDEKLREMRGAITR
jgi:hypothetical protein